MNSDNEREAWFCEAQFVTSKKNCRGVWSTNIKYHLRKLPNENIRKANLKVRIVKLMNEIRSPKEIMLQLESEGYKVKHRKKQIRSYYAYAERRVNKWTFENVFDGIDDAKIYLKRQKIWSLKFQNRSHFGMTYHYRCQLVPKVGPQCAARKYFIFNNCTKEVKLYQKDCLHTHKEIVNLDSEKKTDWLLKQFYKGDRNSLMEHDFRVLKSVSLQNCLVGTGMNTEWLLKQFYKGDRNALMEKGFRVLESVSLQNCLVGSQTSNQIKKFEVNLYHGKQENRDTQNVFKPRPFFASDWVFEYKFPNEQMALDYLTKDDIWQFDHTNNDDNSEGYKVHYRCNHLNKTGLQCAAGKYLLYTIDSDEISVYKTRIHSHETISIKYNRTYQRKSEISDCVGRRLLNQSSKPATINDGSTINQTKVNRFRNGGPDPHISIDCHVAPVKLITIEDPTQYIPNFSHYGQFNYAAPNRQVTQVATISSERTHTDSLYSDETISVKYNLTHQRKSAISDCVGRRVLNQSIKPATINDGSTINQAKVNRFINGCYNPHISNDCYAAPVKRINIPNFSHYNAGPKKQATQVEALLSERNSNWLCERSFASFEEAQTYIRKQTEWESLKTTKIKNQRKIFYRCRMVQKFGQQCDAGVYLLCCKGNNQNYYFFRNTAQHTHNQIIKTYKALPSRKRISEPDPEGEVKISKYYIKVSRITRYSGDNQSTEKEVHNKNESTKNNFVFNQSRLILSDSKSNTIAKEGLIIDGEPMLTAQNDDDMTNEQIIVTQKRGFEEELVENKADATAPAIEKIVNLEENQPEPASHTEESILESSITPILEEIAFQKYASKTEAFNKLGQEADRWVSTHPMPVENGYRMYFRCCNYSPEVGRCSCRVFLLGRNDSDEVLYYLSSPHNHEFWLLEKEFKTHLEAEDYLKEQEIWTFNATRKSRRSNEFYRCNLTKKSGEACAAAKFISFNSKTQGFSLYKNGETHTHNPLTSASRANEIFEALDDATNDKIKELVMTGHRLNDILAELGKVLVPFNKSDLYCYITKLRRKLPRKMTSAPPTIKAIETWLSKITAIPKDEHEPYCVSFNVVHSNESFRCFFSTKRLLKNAVDSNLVHLDSTSKLHWQDNRVTIIGTTDLDQKFHLFGIAICTNKEEGDYEFIFKTIQKGVQECYKKRFQPECLITDCNEAVRDAFIRRFGISSEIGVCSKVALFKIMVKLSTCMGSDLLKNQIQEDILKMQKLSSSSLFFKAVDLFFQKWKSQADVNLDSFLKYFKMNWVYRNQNWFLGFRQFTPHTNKAICTEYNLLRNSLPFIINPKPVEAFRYLFRNEMERLSRRYTRHDSQFVRETTVPKSVYEKANNWDKFKKQFEIQNHETEIHYYISSRSDTLISKEKLRKYRACDEHQTFDEFLDIHFSFWCVRQLKSDDKLLCNCPYFLENFVCEHSVGIAKVMNIK